MKAKSKLKDGKIDFGDIEMTDEEYRESQNPKVRTTIFLDADLIRAYKKQATQKGMKYQQLMRETLKSALNASLDIEDRLRILENEILKKKKTGT